MKVDPKRVPLSAYLGAVGMPGVTAYVGLLDIGAPKEGRDRRGRAPRRARWAASSDSSRRCAAAAPWASPGGAEKCALRARRARLRRLRRLQGRRSSSDDLRAATPKGIDVYFENVGGEVLDAVLARLNPFARIPLCGLVSQYNETKPYGVKNFGSLLTNRVKLEGFIVSERMARWPEALGALGGWVAEAEVRYRETDRRGTERAARVPRDAQGREPGQAAREARVSAARDCPALREHSGHEQRYDAVRRDDVVRAEERFRGGDLRSRRRVVT